MLTKLELRTMAHFQPIQIRSLGNYAELFLLFRNYGPFFQHELYEIPISCALKMSEFNFCVIQIPYWLKKHYLEDIKEKEKKSEEYQEIYPYIFELYQDLLKYVKKNRQTIHQLISDIRHLRLQKTLKGLKKFDGNALCLNNLTVYEYNQIKPLLINGMQICERFGGTLKNVE